jgi:hypothetical protein
VIISTLPALEIDEAGHQMQTTGSPENVAYKTVLVIHFRDLCNKVGLYWMWDYSRRLL